MGPDWLNVVLNPNLLNPYLPLPLEIILVEPILVAASLSQMHQCTNFYMPSFRNAQAATVMN